MAEPHRPRPDGSALAGPLPVEEVAERAARLGITIERVLEELGSIAFAKITRIVSWDTDKLVKVWDADKGSETLTLKGHTGGVLGVAFSPDGKRLATASGGSFQPAEVKVWDADTGTETLTLKGHIGDVTSVAISADGKRIVSGSWDSTVKVWDADKGTEVANRAH